MCIGIPNWPVIFRFWCCSTIEFMVKSHVLRIQSRFLPFFHTLCSTAFIYQSASRWVYFVLQTILSWFYKCIWLVVSNILFSISYMGCHPKPIDFHSIIFQDGYCTTNQRLPLFHRNRWPEAAPATAATAATAAEVVGMGKRGCSAGAYWRVPLEPWKWLKMVVYKPL